MTNTPESTDKSDPVTLIDNLGAPDVFADRVAGVFLTNGNVHMTFVSRRCDYTKTPNVFHDVVIGRLVMPFPEAEGTARFLLDFVERMKKAQGVTSPDVPKTLQ
jgi:hypothetical protein